jgi:pimeloyl-ACP methyl ester carboxylesterase
MPYIDNHGARIHYQVEGQGQPLVLCHGLSMTSEDWREYGYVTGLRDRYMLTLIDSRGYGASDKPHDPLDYLARPGG